MSCDVWQQVLALDSRYSAVRPITKSSTELRQLYLRRRNQLTREKAALSVNEAFRHPNLSCSFQYAAETSVASFVAYRNIRYIFRLSYTRKTETLGESYAFSGIEHIFDHHSGAVNRLSFANHDSSRLALASSDGTVSICRISPASGVFSIACVLPEYRVKQTEITDIAWSMTNEFLASTSLDGNICLWDVGEAKLAREYLSTELKLGPLLTCAFQPANNNIFAVGSVTGIIQMVNLSTGKTCVRGMDRIHVAARGSKTRLNSSVTELRGFLGTGCITTLAFENATGNYLWVGTDRGIIQSYLCEPSTGFIIRSQRVDISSLNLSVVPTCPENGIKLNNLLYERPPSTRKTYFLSKADQSFKRWSSLKSRARTHNAIDKLHSNGGSSLAPSITSLSIYSWLSKEKSETYLLINAAGIGLLLLRLTLDNRNVILEQRFPVHHRSFNSVPKTLRLIHSCFAPLISFRSGACAASGSEDCNVYLYNVLRSRNADPATGNSSSHNKQTSTGVVTILQGHTAPVLDVAISWDENMLASADEKGSVIIWRRQEKSDTS
ncbi:unnamed protein product [Schistosoma mattheei]|uniref:Anaphase-promoting complex subunit 4-like WD40 domain-containing protein n=2 Tax=Schistosoma mattheei TaxID=31246 RepID=A0AA85BWS8_9TREM|nr:unnamed protein product [Schistosoma mattheei]